MPEDFFPGQDPASAATQDTSQLEPEGDTVDEGSESDPAPDANEPREAKPPAKGVQKRLDELTRNWRSAERRNEQLISLLTQRQKPEQEPPAPKVVTKVSGKTLDDFDGDVGAYVAHQVSETLKTEREKLRSEMKAEESQRSKADRFEAYKAREKSYAQESGLEDYEEIAHYAPINDTVADIVQEMDMGPAVAYYLGKNPAEAREISRMSPTAAAIKLAKIEAKVEAEHTKAKEAKKRGSGAPDPAPKLEGSDPAIDVSADSPDSDKLSTDEWLRRRKKQLSRKK